MIDLNDLVRRNAKIQRFVKDCTPGPLDRYIGTLDVATARFNTILLKLSQEPLLLDEHALEVQECFDAIQSFYKNTMRLVQWHPIFKPFVRVMLHGIGTRRIPKIKRLVERINN
jgi:hypothetical protein